MKAIDTPPVSRTDPDPRDARALTEYLTVLDNVGRAQGADGLYLVVSQSGKEYLVDAQLGVCECPDSLYRHTDCKHLRRVAFATGTRPIPPGIDPDRIDELLGRHVTPKDRE